ncbi:hypothetical protein A3K73_05145 [Candidatus Pacearchaeota archaeon RBG_13_36_9]|nr:MAG: hypothetical protein A3K73_05145 [Candidatus Pacearchaeota archaeon RBG_13_36_9]
MEHNDRNYDLEDRIKNYILNNKEVPQQLLIKHLKSNYSAVKKSLEDAGICLLPKSWHTKNKVLKAYNLGLSYEEIGEKLGMGKVYVNQILNRLGKHCRTRTGLELYSEEKVLESYNRGNHTFRELADDLNISKHMVKKLKIKYGLPLFGMGRRKGRKKICLLRDRLLKLGYSQTMVAEIEGVTRFAIYEYLNRNPKIREVWEKARKNRKRA